MALLQKLIFVQHARAISRRFLRDALRVKRPDCIGKFPERTVGDLTRNNKISTEARRKILWDNPVRLYELEV